MPSAPHLSFRVLTGWGSEYANRALPGRWPQIILDDAFVEDMTGYFALAAESGYTDVILWGLFVDRDWPEDLSILNPDGEAAKPVHRLLTDAHRHGLRVHCGLGLFSWGFEEIIRLHPALSRGNARAMCPSLPESWDWMRRIVDGIIGNFAFDGLDMQSADQGRCPCPDCAALGDVAYHSWLNRETADYARARRPELLCFMDNWGVAFDRPEDSPILAAASGHISGIIDYNNSADAARDGHRARLIQTLSSPFGTLSGPTVWNPQRWEKDRWFLPTTSRNDAYLQALYADGGQIGVVFVTPSSNPSGEISLRYLGKRMKDLSAPAEELLAEAVEETYRPHDDATRAALTQFVLATETAYFGLPDISGVDPHGALGLFLVDAGFPEPSQPGDPPPYLLHLSAERRAGYRAALEIAAREFAGLRPFIGRADAAERTERCLNNVLADLSSIAAVSSLTEEIP